MSAKGGDVSDDNEDWGKGNYLEAALGYYKPIGKCSVFEIYGGGGGGNQHHQAYLYLEAAKNAVAN